MDVDARLEAVEAENDMLRERIAELERLLGMSMPAPIELGLTGQQARVFGVLMAREVATKEHVMAALYGLNPDGGADPKIVDVFVHHVRRKVKPFGIEIETVWGQGYRITQATKALVRERFMSEAA